MARRPKSTTETVPPAEPLAAEAGSTAAGSIAPSEAPPEAASVPSISAKDAPADSLPAPEQEVASAPLEQKSELTQEPEAAQSAQPEDSGMAPVIPPPVVTRPSYLAVCLLALITGAAGGAGAAIFAPKYLPQLAALSPLASAPAAPAAGTATPAPAPTTAPSASAASTDRLAALEAALQAQAGRDSALRAEINTLTTRIAEAKQGNTNTGDPARLGTLEAQLGSLAKNHTALRTLTLAQARFAASERLKVVLESGAPLAAALENLKTLGVPAEKFAALNAFTTTGAPSLAVLRAEFAAARAAILQAKATEEKDAAQKRAEAEAEKARNAPPPANWQEALTAKAGALFEQAKQKTAGLIDIRGKGEKPTAPTPSDKAVEDALTRGDIAAAITALEARPEAERTFYAPLRAKLDARSKALATVKALAEEADIEVQAALRAVPQ